MLFYLFYLFLTVSAKGKCSAKCQFDNDLITSKTIDLWPKKCTKVCGRITINSSSDVTMEQLEDKFANLDRIVGFIQIGNSTLTNLSFLSNLNSFYCYRFEISNNSVLENADFLNHLNTTGAYAKIKFENNPKLDVSSFCQLEDLLQVSVYESGNLKGCECHDMKVDANSISNYPNCTSINGTFGLKISDISDSKALEAFENLTFLSRGLEVTNTDFTNLSFLSNVTAIYGDGRFGEPLFNIHDNPKMTRFGMTGLKTLGIIYDGPFSATFSKLHPDFCLTTEEMQMFADNRAYFMTPTAKYCSDEEQRSDGQKLCVFRNMSSLESDCIHIRGNVLIESGDEGYVQKLETVQYIFGGLIISNTTLTDLNFLGQLRNVASLKMYPSVRIMNNKLLVKADLPNVKHLLSIEDFTIVFMNNSEKLLKTGCLEYENGIGASILVNTIDCNGVNIWPHFVDEDGELEENRVGICLDLDLIAMFYALVILYFRN